MSVANMAGATRARVPAIDAFRGLTILVMIFVNQLAGVSGMPQWIRHMPADADAMTFVDGVFPAFLFIVGMSIPFAIAQRQRAGDDVWALNRHIVFRAASLIVFGLFMVNAEDGFNQQAMPLPIAIWSLLFYGAAFLIWSNLLSRWENLRRAGCLLASVVLVVLAFAYRSGAQGQGGMTIQWWGILGLIGWAYLLSSVFFQLSRGKIVGLSVALILCTAYYAAANTSWGKTCWWLSQDGNAAHTSICLCGLMLSQILFGNSNSANQKRWRVAVLMVVCVVAALALRPYFGISKIYATPSWCLFSAAACIAIFYALYVSANWAEPSRFWTFLQPVASQPLLTYLIPFIIEAAMQALNLSWPADWMHGWRGVLLTLVYVLAVVLLVRGLTRCKLRLQL